MDIFFFFSINLLNLFRDPQTLQCCRCPAASASTDSWCTTLACWAHLPVKKPNWKPGYISSVGHWAVAMNSGWPGDRLQRQSFYKDYFGRFPSFSHRGDHTSACWICWGRTAAVQGALHVSEWAEVTTVCEQVTQQREKHRINNWLF